MWPEFEVFAGVSHPQTPQILGLLSNSDGGMAHVVKGRLSVCIQSIDQPGLPGAQ